MNTKNISATFDLCTYTENKKTGDICLTTRYSFWHTQEFKSEKEIMTFAKGMANGLSYKWARAAVRVTYNGQTKEITA